MRIKVTLGIGYSNANHEDVIDIDNEEWSACETDAAREELMWGYWEDWSNNYIEGSVGPVEE